MARDTTYGRDAERAKIDGRKGMAAARGDAMGELYCDKCGYKKAARDCPKCDE